MRSRAKTWVVIRSVGLLMTAMLIAQGPGVAGAVETIDDGTPGLQDFGLLPSAADLGPWNDVLESLMPIWTDAPALADSVISLVLADASCSLTVNAPFKDGTVIDGKGIYDCTRTYPAIGIRVCVDVRQSGQWREKKCHTRVKENADKISAHSRPVCEVGRWKYRTRAAGVSVDSQGDPVAQIGPGIIESPTNIRCQTQ